MFLVTVTVVFVILLARFGRIGPFVWDPAGAPGPRRQPTRCGGPGPRADTAGTPETVLARRLADGDITPEEYLERLSLLQER